ncbi:MAG: sulfite exporter TauE/SafE family protein, partial [Acidobacteria bacterium]|nr:sulfite exporter TauE/SafE family protein [Acidobacteriota bacterium]
MQRTSGTGHQVNGMDFLYVEFPVSGVQTWIFLPPLVAFAVSFFSSMGGVSGAFFLLPYQVSVLNFITPSVSSTNFVYNVFAIPSGVYRYIRDGKLAWPLAGIIVAGTLPGVFLGYYLRILYLPDPGAFRLFVGCVLLYIAFHLLYETLRTRRRGKSPETIQGKNSNGRDRSSGVGSKNPPAGARIESMVFSIRKIEYAFGGERFSIGTAGIFSVAFVVGIIGGAYGIGGGSILAPFCVAVYGL